MLVGGIGGCSSFQCEVNLCPGNTIAKGQGKFAPFKKKQTGAQPPHTRTIPSAANRDFSAQIFSFPPPLPVQCRPQQASGPPSPAAATAPATTRICVSAHSQCPAPLHVCKTKYIYLSMRARARPTAAVLLAFRGVTDLWLLPGSPSSPLRRGCRLLLGSRGRSRRLAGSFPSGAHRECSLGLQPFHGRPLARSLSRLPLSHLGRNGGGGELFPKASSFLGCPQLASQPAAAQPAAPPHRTSWCCQKEKRKGGGGGGGGGGGWWWWC